MRVLRALVIVAVAGSLAAVALAGEGKVYGKGVSIDAPVAIADLLAKPEAYVGTQVRVDGVISAVCKMRGCWMQVNDPASGKGIRIKVEDGAIVFPMEAMGRKASAQGVFQVVDPAGEHMEQAKHADQESAGAGHACAADGKGEAKPAATYQIAGVGAIIYE